ncbi:DUF4097 family beta strand repeat protein [Streptomyces actinomycinicus]|uniref:DUF4097 family beta strand repeat protein n=1 Tax=Streptomyces actinomycinicus TaxID=1695166 RepID=A0A937EQN2_9ACTN|nr:DUF4097 family beta strand repeat-containing protein [Streptomyces actinomycinicus]MBL1086798.1 DUF4097 family beta strand repeat protein [Streptomyces actinomycinicus]
MTEKTFTASAALPAVADITSHVGQVIVTVNPQLTTAQVKVHTADAEGPLADAVNNTTITEQNVGRESRLRISVPKVDGGISGASTVVQVGGSRFSFNGGIVNTGSMTGVTMSGGDIWVGGQKIVSGGRVVAEQGAVVSGSGVGTITVEVQLPSYSSVDLTTTSADLNIAGALNELRFHTVSGDVNAQGVRVLSGNTTSGDIAARYVSESLSVSSVSGDIEVESYSGTSFSANTVSGDIELAATLSATGAVNVSSVSGDVTTRGAGHLDLRPSTVSGRVRNR